jgi:excisionase family DNA binding protein
VSVRDLVRALLDAMPGAASVTVPRAWVEDLLAGAPAADLAPPSPALTVDLSAREVGALLGRSPATVRAWCEAERVPGAYRFNGREWRIPRAGLDAFLERVRRGETEAATVPDLGAWRRVRRAA